MGAARLWVTFDAAVGGQGEQVFVLTDVLRLPPLRELALWLTEELREVRELDPTELPIPYDRLADVVVVDAEALLLGRLLDEPALQPEEPLRLWERA